jgi:uncharacterized protein YbjT (DUF2867 family)
MPVQLIAVDDIGAVAALAFERPEEFLGRAIELAGDELTMDQAEEIHRRVTSERPRSRSLPFWLMGLRNHEAAVNFRWIGAHGWKMDLKALREQFPWLHTFEDWLEKQ